MTNNSTKSPRALFTLFLLLATGVVLLLSGAASAASPIAKDGRMHACYKAKGKGKGTLRLVGSGKARCPRKWRKVAWQATPVPGPRGPAGSPGSTGQPGLSGLSGVSGADAGAAIIGLEGKVAQLLVKVESLEGILEGVTNQDLLGAIAAVPVLCEQTEDLTGQVNALLGSLGGLNSLLDTLLVLFDPVGLPTTLPAFNCPTG